MKQFYLCEVELLDEAMPYYTFFLHEASIAKAETKAREIAEQDYGEYKDIYITVIEKLEDLKESCL